MTLRIFFDQRVIESHNPSGVRDIATGISAGLEEIATSDDIEITYVGTREPRSAHHRFMKLPARGFMQLWLPLAAARARADRIFIPRQTVPPLSLTPAVPLFHDIGFIRLPQMYPSAQSIKTTSRMAARSGHALAVSQYTVDEIADEGLSNSVKALPIEAVHEIDWSPDDRDPYVLCVAAQEPHKNLPRLIRAWKRAKTDGVRLVLLGRPGLDSEAIRGLTDSATNTGVSIASGLDDARYKELLARCWGYVQPSFYEGLCIPALDLAAAGAPTAISSASNLGRVFRNAPNRGLFDPPSIEQMALSLTALTTDASFRSESSRFNRTTFKMTNWVRVARVAVSAMQ